MKKIIVLLAALMVCQASFAYIREFTTSDTKTLHGRGYSQEAMKIVETARMVEQGEVKDYVPFYSRKITPDNIFGKTYVTIKRWLDPGQDDNVFGLHEVTFSNDFLELTPEYWKGKSPNDKYERLKPKQIERLDYAGKTIEGSNGVEGEGDVNVEDL